MLVLVPPHLHPHHCQVVQTLAERTAALGREGVGVWQAGDDVCLKTCQEFAEQGYLDVDVDEFLDAVYKPN